MVLIGSVPPRRRGHGVVAASYVRVVRWWCPASGRWHPGRRKGRADREVHPALPSASPRSAGAVQELADQLVHLAGHVAGLAVDGTPDGGEDQHDDDEDADVLEGALAGVAAGGHVLET